MSVVVIDNYDSFVFNLVQAIAVITGQRPLVFRNDALDLDQLLALRPSRIVLSPGPGHPADRARIGIGAEILETVAREVPVLGVCLGHQAIVHAFGGRIVRAPSAMHGKASVIHHAGRGLFRGLPPALTAMRYHSLTADPGALPDCLELDAWTQDGVVMAVRHNELPLVGLQFHPESIGTPIGRELLRRFVDLEWRSDPP